jgi:hypothetical protein
VEASAVSIALDVLVRDEYRCFRCGKPINIRRPGNCHHRLSAALGTDEPQNRITLCGFGNNLSDADGNQWCHGFVHQNGREARAPENGWIISRHDERPPETIPVRHWQRGLVLLTADYQFA